MKSDKICWSFHRSLLSLLLLNEKDTTVLVLVNENPKMLTKILKKSNTALKGNVGLIFFLQMS